MAANTIRELLDQAFPGGEVAVEDRTGGTRYDDIEAVIPRAELAAHAEHYKQLSGFSVNVLNGQPPILGAV